MEEAAAVYIFFRLCMSGIAIALLPFIFYLCLCRII